MDKQRTLGSIIQSLRLEHDMTQEQLGELLDVTKSTISMYESGTRMPNIDKLERLTDIFHVDAGYLMGNTSLRNFNRDSGAYLQIPICRRIIPGTSFWKNPDNIQNHIVVPIELLNDSNDFCFAVHGSDPALAGSGFQKDDLLIFRLTDRISAKQRGLFVSGTGEKTALHLCSADRRSSYAEQPAESSNLRHAEKIAGEERCIAVLLRTLS